MNLVELLISKKLSISTAESLTAGMVASAICNYENASKVFKGGIVSYTKETKCSLLGLEMENINKFGVYSEETVISMAKGIQTKTQSDLAIATSGVAGPGSDENVVAGTVYFCFIIGDKVMTERVSFTGSRNEVRQDAAQYAIMEIFKLLS